MAKKKKPVKKRFTHRKMNVYDIILHCTKCSDAMVVYYTHTKDLIASKQLLCRTCGNDLFKVYEVK